MPAAAERKLHGLPVTRLKCRHAHVDLWDHVMRLNGRQRTVMVALKRLSDPCCSAAFVM